MSNGTRPSELPSRLRRTLELVFRVEGVVAARVWHWPGRIAIGVRGGATEAPATLLRRVETATIGLREPGETWDFGILDDDAAPSDPPQGAPDATAGA